MNTKNKTHPQALTVYYDGLCHLCSREIDHYRTKKGSEKILFVDITQHDFNHQKEGLDPVKVHKVMHVKRADGQLATGVDAFLEIWKVLPSFQWLAKLVSVPPFRWAADLGYIGFATIRPLLPRKKHECSESPYCETGDKKS